MNDTKKKTVLYAAALILLTGVVVLSGMVSLNQTTYANGWDAYYYLIQVKALLETGEMHSPEYSLVYLPVLGWHALTGDYILSYKLAAVLIQCIFVLSVFCAAFSLLQNRPETNHRYVFAASLFTAALAAMSPSLNYFFVQFPKNLLGFAFFFFFMAGFFAFSRYVKKRENASVPRDLRQYAALSIRAAGLILLFLAAFFTHRFSAVLSMLFLLLYFAPSLALSLKRLVTAVWKGNAKTDKTGIISILRRHRGKAVISACILAGGVFILLAVSHRLPLGLSLYDIEIITDNFSITPMFPPVEFINVFGSSKISALWMVEIIAGSLLLLITAVLLVFKKHFAFLRMGKEYIIVVITALIGLFPFFRFSLTGISYRLFFGTLLMLPLVCVPYVAFEAERLARFVVKGDIFKKTAAFAAAFIAVLVLSFYTGASYNSKLHDPPYDYYTELAGRTLDVLKNKDFELIIAHKALAELITFQHGVDALPWAPEEWFARDRVWRITAGLLREDFTEYLPPDILEDGFVPLEQDYALLREDYWESFLTNIADDPSVMESVQTWRNPLEQRPAYLMKGK